MSKDRLVQMRFSEKEIEWLDAMCEQLAMNRSELIRQLVRERHLKLNPAYVVKAREKKPAAPAEPEPELTNEQLCEKAGGKVQRVDGVEMCVFQLTTAMQRRVPLNKPELFEK